MRAAVNWDDSDGVVHLAQDGHNSRFLDNSQIVVVSAWEQRYRLLGYNDAARAQRKALRPIQLMSPVLCGDIGVSLARFRQHRRQGSLLPHDHGCPPAPRELCLAAV